MKNRSGEKIKLASIDELLGVVNEESAMEIEISKIHPFKNHPFKVLDDEKMQELVESVKINGVLAFMWEYMKVPENSREKVKNLLKDANENGVKLSHQAPTLYDVVPKEEIAEFEELMRKTILLTLVLIFMFQSEVILKNPIHIILIAIPLIIQTFLIFGIAYVACYLLKLPHNIAAPAGMIGASNFFELAVAVAIALFGTTSEAALATTVGVLTEVPVMLMLVRIANKTKGRFL